MLVHSLEPHGDIERMSAQIVYEGITEHFRESRKILNKYYIFVVVCIFDKPKQSQLQFNSIGWKFMSRRQNKSTAKHNAHSGADFWLNRNVSKPCDRISFCFSCHWFASLLSCSLFISGCRNIFIPFQFSILVSSSTVLAEWVWLCPRLLFPTESFLFDLITATHHITSNYETELNKMN